MTNTATTTATTTASETVKIKLADGALTDAPIWCNHRRGRNWLAVIEADPTAPGGLARRFVERAKGAYYYIAESVLKPYAALEFGADYYTGSGNKQASRFYGVIVARDDNAIEIERAATGLQAIKRAKELRGARGDEDIRRAILKRNQAFDKFITENIYCCASELVEALRHDDRFSSELQPALAKEGGEPKDFWLVSDFLAMQLYARGEMVARDFLGLNIWGRKSSGRAFDIDDTLEHIFKSWFSPDDDES